MEATIYSLTRIFKYQNSRRHNGANPNLDSHRRENLKPLCVLFVLIRCTVCGRTDERDIRKTFIITRYITRNILKSAERV